MQPYFSIILPIYNVEKYLKRCLSSIFEQDYTDYEIILVDDGSTDSSAVICDEFAAACEQIRVIHKTNGGLSSARNAGFQLAAGKYIWWIDSDDWITPDALKKLYEATTATNPDIVKFNHYRVEEQVSKVLSNAPQGFFDTCDALQSQLGQACNSAGRYVLSAWSHVYRREWLQQIGAAFVSERIVGSEDYLFQLSVLPKAKSLQVIPDTLYFYEKREGSLSQKYRKNLAEQYTELYRQLIRTAAEESRQLFAGFYVWHLISNTCIPHEYYRLTQEHSLCDGRRNVRAFFTIPEMKSALRKLDRKNLTWKKKVQLWAMKCGFEPFFYWLYVIKPGR